MFNIAVNFPGLWWWGYFQFGMEKIPGSNCWHCLPCLQRDKRTHMEGVRKPFAHWLVVWAPVEVPSTRAWETYVPEVKCGDFAEIISVSLRSLFEVFLSLLILNETKESGKMEVLGFGNRCSSSKKEFCFKNILLCVLRRLEL